MESIQVLVLMIVFFWRLMHAEVGEEIQFVSNKWG